eukprot:4502782-Pyramimonas_sp.AAC.1
MSTRRGTRTRRTRTRRRLARLGWVSWASWGTGRSRGPWAPPRCLLVFRSAALHGKTPQFIVWLRFRLCGLTLPMLLYFAGSAEAIVLPPR